MLGYKKLRNNLYSADLVYGKIDLKYGHTFSCYFIVRHADDLEFIEKQALQLLLAGCQSFIFWGDKASAWRQIVTRRDRILRSIPTSEATIFTSDHTELDTFSSVLFREISVRSFIPHDVYLLYDDETIYEEVLQRLEVLQDSLFRKADGKGLEELIGEPRVKCPRCGSMDTARIIRGWSSVDDTLREAADAGIIHLGVQREQEAAPRRYCNSCRKKFGAPAQIIKDRKALALADDVIGLEYWRVVFVPLRWSPKLTIIKTDHDAVVKLNSWDGTDNLPFEREYTIEKTRWDCFVTALFDDLYLNDWEQRYEDPNFCDGEGWHLKLQFSKLKEREYSGQNQFPPYWNEFQQLLEPFIIP